MLYSCCDLASWSWARISPICLRVCVTGSTLLPRHDVWPAAKQHAGMCVHFSLSFGSFGPRAKERIEPNLADELFPELLPNSYVCHPLLFYLSYLCDHSACQRAGGLELMLKSEYWNHSQGTTKTNTKLQVYYVWLSWSLSICWIRYCTCPLAYDLIDACCC